VRQLCMAVLWGMVRGALCQPSSWGGIMKRGAQCAISAVVVLISFSILCGCSSQNPESIFNSDTGKHPNDWLPGGHMTAARTNIASCNECHGADLAGGISHVSCTSCHLGGPTSIHPADWVPLLTKHGPYAEANGTASCANQWCHGPQLSGVAGSGPACTSCHPFPFDPTKATCATCHSSQMGSRRPVLGPNGDFGQNAQILSHHVAGTADPTAAQCEVCHDMSEHTSGTVRLRNADTGASIVYSASVPSSLETFCLSCHDADGALMTSVTGETQVTPFGDGSTLGTPPYPYATRINSSWKSAYGHGTYGNHATGTRLTCLGTGQPGTGCHGSSGRINAHGSTSQVLSTRAFKYDIAASGPTYIYDESNFDLCFNCHDSYPSVSKTEILGVKFGGLLDTSYGPPGPRGQNPPYDTGGLYLTHFADHNDPLNTANPLNDPVFWGTADMNLHWFHLGLQIVSFRGTGTVTGITCVNCHDVHGSSFPYSALYDELAYSSTTTLGNNMIGEMVYSAYTTTLLEDYPTYCSFNCHTIQGPTKAWFSPLVE
jgi:hypothetical protein